MAAVGDRLRFVVFARFLRETFPEATKVADVAGGRGLLSLELRQLGFTPTIIDPRLVTNLPHRVRRALRREALQTGRVPRVPRLHARLEEVDLSEFDLVVGLHLDQASEPLARRAVELGKPFALVPCCVMPLDGLGRSYADWVTYLAALAPGSRIAHLPMQGANMAVYRVGLRGSSDTPHSTRDGRALSRDLSLPKELV